MGSGSWLRRAFLLHFLNDYGRVKQGWREVVGGVDAEPLKGSRAGEEERLGDESTNQAEGGCEGDDLPCVVSPV